MESSDLPEDELHDLRSQEADAPSPEEQEKTAAQAPVRPPLRIKRALTVIIVLIVAAVVLFAVVSFLTQCVDCDGFHSTPFKVSFYMTNETGNWTLLVTYAPSWLTLRNVTVTIMDANGTSKAPMHDVPLANLTESNWDTYHVVYRKLGNESNILTGARVVVNQAHYPAGCWFMVWCSSGILAFAAFQ